MTSAGGCCSLLSPVIPVFLVDGFGYVVSNEKHPAPLYFPCWSKTNGRVFCYCFAGRHFACYLFWQEAAVVKEAPNAAFVLAAGWLGEIIG
jgi:hypothetical protein